MTNLARRGSAILCLAVSLTSCAKHVLHPPSQDARSLLNGAGVVAFETGGQSTVDRPVSGGGEGAAVGAGQGAFATFGGFTYGGCASGGPLGCAVGIVLGVALMPVGAIVGAGVGAAKAHSTEEVEGIAKAIDRRMAQTWHSKQLGSEIERVARLRGAPKFAWRESGESIDSFAERLPAILSVSVQHVGFAVSGKFEPTLRLQMTAVATLRNRETGEQQYRQGWAYSGPATGFFDIGRNDAAGLQEQFAFAYGALAAAVLDHLESQAPQPADLSPRAQVRPLPSDYLKKEPVDDARRSTAESPSPKSSTADPDPEESAAPTRTLSPTKNCEAADFQTCLR